MKLNVNINTLPFSKQLMGFTDWVGKMWRIHIGAGDRDMLPFNRSQMDWIHKVADKKNGDLVAFGSTADLTKPGTPIFVNSQFPLQESEKKSTSDVVIGPYCAQPYKISSIFNISAVSRGAASGVAIEAFSRGAKLAGSWLNTGEGGISKEHLAGGADLVFQIGTAKYGVRDENGQLSDDKLREIATHPAVKMFEIKLTQGGKEGKGGILPGAKVDAEVARIRGIPIGKDSISPNRHTDINNISDLMDMIERVRRVTGKPVGFKTVYSESASIRALCEEIKKRGIESAPDFISLDGGDGGTGAAPLILIDNTGLPLRESLPMLTKVLAEYGLKDRIKINASSKLVTPEAVGWALCNGADFISSIRGPFFAAGCVQAMRCHENTCPAGIATNNPRLLKGFDPADKGVQVGNYILAIKQAVETMAHTVGVEEPRQLRPHHVRIVQADGYSKPLNEIYPHLKF